MILFEKIRWKNFLSTGNQYIEIDLKKNDLIPIYGERLHNTQSRNPYNLSFGLGANSIADTNYIKI